MINAYDHTANTYQTPEIYALPCRDAINWTALQNIL